MFDNHPLTPSDPSALIPLTRVGDVAAMLRVMQPLNEVLPDPIAARRQLLADLCRFIGVKVGAISLDSKPDRSPVTVEPTTPDSDMARSPGVLRVPIELSPRLEQTLKYLLDGNSEKQVARHLKLSPHTVHVYVKALYRRFGVSSRAELLAWHLNK